MLLFFKLVDETQIYEPLEATRHHNLIKLLILLPVRTNLLCTLQCETPCNCAHHNILDPVKREVAKISKYYVPSFFFV